MELQSSPHNDKPSSDLNALFEELEKRQPKPASAPSTPRPKSAAHALVASAPRRSAPPPPPSRRAPIDTQRFDDAELIDTDDADATAKHEPSWANAIVPTYDAELDDAPTIARSSPLSLPLSTSRPLAPPPSRVAPLSAPPSRVAPPQSGVRLPPPPSARISAGPASIARLSAPAAPLKSASNLPLPSKLSLPVPTPPPSRRSHPTPSRPLRSAPQHAISSPLPSAPPTSVPAHSVVVTDTPSRPASSSIPPVVARGDSLPGVQPQKRKSGALLLAFGGLALLGVVAGLGFGFKDKLIAASATTGTMVITASGANDAALGSMSVLIDGSERCTSSPCRVSIPAGTHFVRAEAPGFAGTADRAVTVERNGEASLHIALTPTQAPKSAPAAEKAAPAAEPAAPAAEPLPALEVARVSTKPAPAKPSAASARKSSEKAAPAAPAVATGTGTLNINSIPVASVVLDGRPVGSTPLMGLAVSPGPHSVVFIHPEHGRKATGVKVEAGKTSTAAVRF